MTALAKVVYTARTPGGDLAEFEEPCKDRAEAAEYAASIRSKQAARGLPVDAHVEPKPAAVETPSFVVAEFQVRYTCLDPEGDEQAGSDALDGIAEAHLLCARILEYQEQNDLPEDASIWWRPGQGHAWQPWARLAEKAGANA
jgi:hypothetical protein